jgi:hypothetical protein
MVSAVTKEAANADPRVKAKTHKWCRKYHTILLKSAFAKDKASSDGLQNYCKEARKAYDKARYAKPEVKAAVKARNATLEGKAATKASNAKRNADPVRHAAHLKQVREYEARKHATPEGLVEIRSRSRIGAAKYDFGFTWGPLGEDLSRGPKDGPDSTINLLGLAERGWVFYAKYLKERFYGGMTWPNFQIDHIKPLCKFDLNDPEQRKQAFHYTNTRPLFAEDNEGRSDTTWADDEHPLYWNDAKWVLKADWELKDENDKYGLNKYQRKVEPAAEPPAKRRKTSIEDYFSI